MMTDTHYRCQNCDYRGTEFVDAGDDARCPKCNQPELAREFIPEPIKNHPKASNVRVALRGSRHNPDGHVVFKVSDAVQIKATEPDNMGRATKGFVAISIPEDDTRMIVCSCGQEFDSASDAHAHLLDVQGEVSGY